MENGIHYVKNVSGKTLRQLNEEIPNPDPRLFFEVLGKQAWLCLRR